MARYLYEGMQVIAELDGVGAVVKSFYWGHDISDTPGGAGGIGGLLMVVDDPMGTAAGTKAWFVGYDGRGNVSLMLDSADGSLDAAFEYSPYGRTHRASGPAVAAMPFRYQTKWLLDNSPSTTDHWPTDLYDYGLRMYDAQMGRFISRDPLGENGGMNLYAAFGNDPVNRWDYLGLDVPYGGELETVEFFGEPWITYYDPNDPLFFIDSTPTVLQGNNLSLYAGSEVQRTVFEEYYPWSDPDEPSTAERDKCANLASKYADLLSGSWTWDIDDMDLTLASVGLASEAASIKAAVATRNAAHEYKVGMFMENERIHLTSPVRNEQQTGGQRLWTLREEFGLSPTQIPLGFGHSHDIGPEAYRHLPDAGAALTSVSEYLADAQYFSPSDVNILILSPDGQQRSKPLSYYLSLHNPLNEIRLLGASNASDRNPNGTASGELRAFPEGDVDKIIECIRVGYIDL